MWSLYDGRRCLERPRSCSKNIEHHIDHAGFGAMVSANTDPKGDRSRAAGSGSGHAAASVKETDKAGIIVRGARPDRRRLRQPGLVKPTIANWGDDKLSDYAVGFICDMGLAGPETYLPLGFAGRRLVQDYPLSNRCDEVDTLLVFDNRLVPGRTCCSTAHPRGRWRHAAPLAPSPHAILTIADMMIGVAAFNVKQTGLDKQQAVREKKTGRIDVLPQTINAT